MRCLALYVVAALVCACSSKHEDSTGAGADPNTLNFEFDAQVAVGKEIQLCKYVTMPTDASEYAVGRMSHDYTAGSHHFLVYRTDLDAMPAGGDTFVDCTETDWMSQVRGVIYGAQSTNGEFNVPDGVAQRFKPGEVMLVQAHYLNTSGKDLDAKMRFHMRLVDPASVTQEAGVLFFFNPAIVVPASGSSSAELTCPLESDATLGFASSHMHKRGVGYTATTSDPSANAALGPLYQTTKWDEPVPRVFPLDPPATLAAGSTISYHCDYQNPDATTILAGTSAQTSEMCMFVAMYWPRQSQDVEFCKNGVVTGGGATSAVDTLGCMVQCGGPKNATCAAGCWQSACPKAPEAIFAFLECAGGTCSSCFLDPTGQACADCANQSCQADYSRLLSATCAN